MALATRRLTRKSRPGITKTKDADHLRGLNRERRWRLRDHNEPTLYGQTEFPYHVEEARRQAAQ